MGCLLQVALITSAIGGVPDLEVIQHRIDAEGLRWQAGETPFSTGERPLPELPQQNPFSDMGHPLSPPLEAPSTSDPQFSWHDVWGEDFMTPVRDQGSCGACFAFSTLGAVEALFAVAVGQPRYDADLSEQHAISCVELASCADGGLPQDVAQLLVDQGVVDEPCRPYQASDVPECSAGLCGDATLRLARIAEWGTSVLPWNDSELKWQLAHGPLVVNMRVYDDFFAYRSGVYARTRLADPVGWHAVVLVGWDDSDGSWIARNSWGRKWGEGGYFRIGRDSDCGLLDGVCFASNATIFSVDQAQAPALPCIHPWQLDATVESTAVLARFDVNVTNCGGHAPLAWSARAPLGIQLLPGAGLLEPGQSAQIEILIDVATLAHGANELSIPFKAQAGESVLALLLEVSPPGSPLEVDFTAWPPSGPAPLRVAFTNRTSGVADGFFWDFGDGAGSQERSPVHVYRQPGQYSVSLVASRAGESESKSYESLITVVAAEQRPESDDGCDCAGQRGGVLEASLLMAVWLWACRRRLYGRRSRSTAFR